MKDYTTNTNSVVNTIKDYYGVSDELSGFTNASIKSLPSHCTNGTYYTVFDGPYSGCYYSYSDACEAAWHSTELVGIYKKLTSAKHALHVYKKKNVVG